jgi:hypothetical protein
MPAVCVVRLHSHVPVGLGDLDDRFGDVLRHPDPSKVPMTGAPVRALASVGARGGAWSAVVGVPDRLMYGGA